MAEELIKPYGDKFNDGIVQLSFTLPVECGARARKAAADYVSRLNFKEISISHMEKIAEGYTFFVIYAKARPKMDFSKIEATEIKTVFMNYGEVNRFIKEKINRIITVVGASIGSDAHTVGIDAIMNMKGFNHDWGLERYPQINAVNLGSQVEIDDLIKKAVELKADAVLVSQIVTQQDAHKENARRLISNLEEKNLRSRFILVLGGPRITNELAVELGFDAGFGPQTLPSHVASFIAKRIIELEGRNK